MTTLQDYFNQLNPLTPSTWEKVQALFIEDRLEKEDHFIREGEAARSIGFLEKGIVRAYYRHTDGTEYNKHFFIAPCFIGGYASLITGTPNQINQQALTGCKIRTADFPKLHALYDTCPDLERATRVLAERFFVAKEQREIELVLLEASERYRLFQKQFPGLEQEITQYHIASYLGITPTQLSRIRSKK